MEKLLEAVERRGNGKAMIEGKNEEFILNSISCITNVLFYDTPQEPLFSDATRLHIFRSSKDFILAT